MTVLVMSRTFIRCNSALILLSALLAIGLSTAQRNGNGYDILEGGYSSRNWRNLYKYGSPSKKIGGEIQNHLHNMALPVFIYVLLLVHIT